MSGLKINFENSEMLLVQDDTDQKLAMLKFSVAKL
jgi:hypothetical protein